MLALNSLSLVPFSSTRDRSTTHTQAFPLRLVTPLWKCLHRWLVNAVGVSIQSGQWSKLKSYQKGGDRCEQNPGGSELLSIDHDPHLRRHQGCPGCGTSVAILETAVSGNPLPGRHVLSEPLRSLFCLPPQAGRLLSAWCFGCT